MSMKDKLPKEVTELDNSDELVKTDDKANQSEAIILVDVTPAPKKEPKEDQPSIVVSSSQSISGPNISISSSIV